MKRLALILGAVVLLSGCGGDDRSALARQTVSKYWDAIAHNRPNEAFALFTSGNRASRKKDEFNRNVLAYLLKETSLKAQVGTPNVDGDKATVPVTLVSPREQGPLKAYQHLFWENGSWHITDYPGLLSNAR